MIAADVGVGRRTLFRYYDSKNDTPWGQFTDTLAAFAVILNAAAAGPAARRTGAPSVASEP